MFTNRVKSQSNLIFYVLKRFWHRVYKKDQMRTGNAHRIRFSLYLFGQRIYRLYKLGVSKHRIRELLRINFSATQSSLTEFDEVQAPNDSGQPQTQSGTCSDEREDSEPEDTGIVYIRVSSQEQASDGDSLETQREQLMRIAEEKEISLHCDPISDKAKTGTSFDREGIRRVFREARKEGPSYLLVQDVDRLGRAAAETLYFVYILQEECGVTLITTSGEKDISNTRGLMETTLLSLMAEITNEVRTRKAKDSSVRNFLEKKNWTSGNPVVPLGYEETEEGWIRKQPDKTEIVEEMFEEFLDCGMYSETQSRITDRHGDVFDGHRVKTLLQEPAYKGKPQLSPDSVGDYEGDLVLDEPELQIVDEDTFDEAQQVIQDINEKYSRDNGDGLLDFIEEFDLFSVVESSPPVKLLCESCRGRMVKNGQRSLSGAPLDGHMYKCTECGESRQWPREDDYERIELLQKLPNLTGLLERLTN
jgi:DNA invertase Pin-like site-specific DNA recombinase/transposase-like protein